LAKSDDIWLLGRHVADMSATFSAKLQTMLHSMCNTDEQPRANTSFRCTYPGLTNKDYARHYAGSPLGFSGGDYGEMDNVQNLEEVECIDGDQKQKSKKRRRHQSKDQMEEVMCIDGNQK
jgi:hypothetical protein